MSHLGYEIKKLGFGLMRLPKRGDNIDVEQVKVMVDRFLADGFTYFDTAWAYPGSEDAIRQALVERHPREAFQLATKNAAWIKCKSREEAIGQFETSLRQTGAGYFDFYLLHNLGESRTHQACGILLPLHAGGTGADSIRAPGNGIRAIANKLWGLGKSRRSVQSLLRSGEKA